METQDAAGKLTPIAEELVALLGPGWSLKEPDPEVDNQRRLAGPEGRGYLLWHYAHKGQFKLQGVLPRHPCESTRLPYGADNPVVAASDRRDHESIAREFRRRLATPYEDLFRQGQTLRDQIVVALEGWLDCAGRLARVLGVSPPAKATCRETTSRKALYLPGDARGSGTVEPNYDGSAVDLHLHDVPLDVAVPFLAALVSPVAPEGAHDALVCSRPSQRGPLRAFST